MAWRKAQRVHHKRLLQGKWAISHNFEGVGLRWIEFILSFSSELNYYSCGSQVSFKFQNYRELPSFPRRDQAQQLKTGFESPRLPLNSYPTKCSILCDEIYERAVAKSIFPNSIKNGGGKESLVKKKTVQTTPKENKEQKIMSSSSTSVIF